MQGFCEFFRSIRAPPGGLNLRKLRAECPKQPLRQNGEVNPPI